MALARPDRTTLLSLSALLAACAWATREHLRVPVLPYDDAFITYRYVENLVRGAGLTYNPPERVWGFTSPLHLGWLSALRLLMPTADLPTLAVRSNVVFVLAAGVTTLLLIRRYTGDVRLAALAACLLLVHPSLLSISSGGMESVLFVWLVLLTLLVLTYERRALVAGLLIGVSCLARPEGTLLVPLAFVRYCRSPRELVPLLVGAAIVPGLWFLFAATYFGSILPLPIVAKSRPLYPLPQWHALGVIFGYLPPTLLGPWLPRALWRDLLAAAVLLAATALSGLHRPLRERQAWMPGAFAVLAIALYTRGNPMFFEWYWPPVQVPALLAVLLGAAALWHLVAARRTTAPERTARVLGRLAYWIVPAWLLAVTVAAYGDRSGGHSWSIRYVHEDGRRLRILTYQKIGEVMSKLTAANESVAAAEVGAFGYYYKARVIDACGLVSPEAIRFLPVPDDQRMGPAAGAVSVDFVRGTYPDWIVTMPIFAEKSLLVSPWFSRYYRLQWRVHLPKRTFDSDDVLVFRRLPH